MATLTNPIEETNLAARFADYVAASANANIVWGTDNLPTYDGVIINNTNMGGPIAGRAPGMSAADLKDGSEIINAANITAALRDETAAYLGIRLLQARVNVTGAGGNSGTRPTPGIIFDQTSKAYLDSVYTASVGTVAGNPVSGTTVTTNGLQTYFSNLQARYEEVRDDQIGFTQNVCHSSCHNSCHNSRGRR